MVADSKWLVFPSSVMQSRPIVCAYCSSEPATVWAPEPFARFRTGHAPERVWMIRAHSLVVEICASILFFVLYGHISPSQWELTMSRESPQSISPPRGTRHHSLGSDANIRNFAPVARIMKTALPDNAKIAKEAKECMQECVSEFISFITSEGTFLRLLLQATFLLPDRPILFQPRRNVSTKNARRLMVRISCLP